MTSSAVTNGRAIHGRAAGAAGDSAAADGPETKDVTKPQDVSASDETALVPDPGVARPPGLGFGLRLLVLIGVVADLVQFKILAGHVIPDEGDFVIWILTVSLTALAVGLGHTSGALLRRAHEHGRRGLVAGMLALTWAGLGVTVYILRVRQPQGSGAQQSLDLTVTTSAAAPPSLLPTVTAPLFTALFVIAGALAAVGAYHHRPSRLGAVVHEAWRQHRANRITARKRKQAKNAARDELAQQSALARRQRARDDERQRAERRREEQAHRATQTRQAERARAQAALDAAERDVTDSRTALATARETLARLEQDDARLPTERHQQIAEINADAAALRQDVRLALARLLADPASTSALTTDPHESAETSRPGHSTTPAGDR